jgi:hypothetical protein
MLHAPGNALCNDTLILFKALNEKNAFKTSKKIQKIPLHNNRFKSSFQVIRLQQEVYFPNLDSHSHNLYSPSEILPFDLGYYAFDALGKKIIPEQSGLIEVFCSLYLETHITLLCLDDEYAVTVAPDGSFEIDLPPGKYRLSTWQLNELYKNLDQEIHLEKSGDLHLEFRDE